MWAGISVYDNVVVARAPSIRFSLGTFIAELRLPANAPIRIEKTGTDEHHFTAWGLTGRLVDVYTIGPHGVMTLRR
jgi:hypothetical protein